MVIKRLWNAGKKPAATHEVPPGQRVYAIGDIHGRRDLLEDLLEIISRDDARRPQAETVLIFLGDLVDRGPESREVIVRLMTLRDSRARARFLLGNHDEVFLKAVLGDRKAMRMLTRIGGRETILSYGVSAEDYQACDFDELARLLSAKVPRSHLDFLKSFENYAEVGDYLFVHAGIRPGIDVADQSTDDLRWIRHEFLNSRLAHGKMIVHGHSIAAEMDVQRNRIGIDTGAFSTGRLSAIGLESDKFWPLVAIGAADPKWGRLSD
jgi:serine/threonine protein phosphatase 1